MKVSIGFVVSVVLLSITGCLSESNESPSVPDAKLAQPFSTMTLTDIEGKRFKLGQSDTRAVLFLFASHTCPIANAYVPRINSVYEDYSQRGVQAFLIQVDPAASTEQLRAHAQEYKLAPPIIHDVDHGLVKRASATVTPQAVLFDPQGKVVYSGRIDDQYVDFGVKRRQPTRHDLVNALDAWLAGKEVKPKTTEAVGCYIGDLSPAEEGFE